MRTIDKRESRGTLGFSMGGFGAFNIALSHPDMFNCMYSICPGAFDPNGLKDAFDAGSWNVTFKNSYGCAFSPNTDIDEPYAEIPKFDGSDDDNRIIANWESGFGDLADKIESYQAQGKPIEYMAFEYGTDEGYKWITSGTIYFSKLLDEKGIKHELIEFKHGHRVTSESIDSFMKLFSEGLEF